VYTLSSDEQSFLRGQNMNAGDYLIEKKIGHVKVWDTSDNFVGEYSDVKTAKKAINAETWQFGQSSANVTKKKWQTDLYLAGSGVYFK
jgi:hypothetical protein